MFLGPEVIEAPENEPQKLIVARIESNGLLLWSYQKDSYYLVPNISTANQILHALTHGSPADLDPLIAQELSSIGVTENSVIRVIDQRLEGRLSAPLDFYFDYTWACNLRCPDCYNRDVARGVTMTDENVQRVFAEMARNGIMRTHLAGGEPTLMPQKLRNYLSAAAQHGIRASVNTNGTNFTPQVANILFESNLISLTFSVDGSEASVHDALRGDGAFNITTAAVQRAVEEKRKRKSPTQIQVKTIWFPHTSNTELESMVLLGLRLGADVVQFHNPERCLYHEKGYYTKVRNEYYERLEFLNSLVKKYSGSIKIWNVCNPLATAIPVGIPGGHGCIGSQELIALNPNGMMTPCLMNPEPLGNLFDEWNGSFADFWRDSQKLQQFNSQIQQVDEKCGDCNAYSYCRGGSKVRSMVDHGTYSQRDPLCPVDYLNSTEGEIAGGMRVEDRRIQQNYDHLIAIAVTHSL